MPINRPEWPYSDAIFYDCYELYNGMKGEKNMFWEYWKEHYAKASLHHFDGKFYITTNVPTSDIYLS